MPVNTDNILSMTQKEEHAQNDDVTLIDRFSSITSPLSTTTDILYTEVDYCLNEVGDRRSIRSRIGFQWLNDPLVSITKSFFFSSRLDFSSKA